MPTFDPSNSECVVYVYRTGIASAVGHDLAVEVTDFEIRVQPHAAEVEGRFVADSLRVRHAMEDGEPRPGKLSKRDKKKIERNIRRDVLEAGDHRVITFRSTGTSTDSGRVHIEGVLDLHGVERPIEVDADAVGDETVARVRLNQPDFDIEPFSALLGALKLEPHVDVELSVPWVPTE
jgi:hypothetical protein